MFAGPVAARWKLRPHCHRQAKLRRFVLAGERALERLIRVIEVASGDFVKCCRLMTPLRLSRWQKEIRLSMTRRDAPNIAASARYG
jgi:hypothetical protein